MGEQIQGEFFSPADFEEFKRRMREETKLLGRMLRDGVLAADPPVGGYEIESWLIGRDGSPLPINEAFLARLDDPNVVPELARYNVELNTPPLPLAGAALSSMHSDLRTTMDSCIKVAGELDADLLMIGILPTLQLGHLTPEAMSSRDRYRALNEQIFRLRQNRPIALNIAGADHLTTSHQNVMLEAGATSFQTHIQVPRDQILRYYNASIVLSAPMVALSANSPFLFGHDLWDETRIPLFEQAVCVAAQYTSRLNRVTFGTGYARESLLECFAENHDLHDVLLPRLLDSKPEELRHLRLQNGTIWRWNRPLIGFDKAGQAHVRIEHRTMPAGPSLVDTIANAAFFFGLVHWLANQETPPELELPFPQARDNFYSSAKDGLRAEITWRNGRYVPVLELLWQNLLPDAREGLRALGLAEADIHCYLEVIEDRLRTGQNGAVWQRRFVEKHGKDMTALTQAYREWQRSGSPVHEWTV